jgi:hypothetical protein
MDFRFLPHPVSIKIFNAMRRLWILLLVLFTTQSFVIEQDRSITGTVTFADDGKPSPGVTVTLKGSKTTALTDANGKYTISVPVKGGTLVFSFVG